MRCITSDNWTFCRYKTGDYMAQITMGADPEGLILERWDYYVTVLEHEIQEVFQRPFTDLASACLYINEHYADWTFEDQTAPKSGCSTCAAH